MTNDEKIAIALKSDYLSELSVYEMLPNSRIRSGFDRRMKKMISESYTDTAKTVRHRRVKLRLAIAVIIAATGRSGNRRNYPAEALGYVCSQGK